MHLLVQIMVCRRRLCGAERERVANIPHAQSDAVTGRCSTLRPKIYVSRAAAARLT